MNVSRRDWLASATVLGAAVALQPFSASAQDAAAEPTKIAPPPPGGLTEESLKTLLEALGLKPTKTEARYDFSFATKVQEEEWTLSMSTVLSADQQSLWIMAWLDELPRSARDVPRSALLGLLATNDKLGKGRFFAYIPTNRRFVLQQVVDNREMSSKKFRGMLVELGQMVGLTYAQWSVAGWKDTSGSDAPEADEQPSNAASKVQTTTNKAGAAPARQATSTTPKTGAPVKK